MRLAMIVAALAAFVPAGCGSGPGFKLAPVSGRVTMNGKPLANAFVQFQPLGNDPGPGSSAVTDSDGRYTLQVASQQYSGAGAVVGTHRVSIGSHQNTQVPSTAEAGSQDGYIPKGGVLERIPARYNQNSELRFEVPPGGTTEANFDLKPR
jgi:hypothetical protein